VIQRTEPVTIEAFEQFEQRPENQDRLFELINGEIVEKLPTEEHGVIVVNIVAPIREWIRQHKRGRVGVEVRHNRPGDNFNARLPDISYRIDTSAPVVRKGGVPVMPDLAVEVQSPGQSDELMAEKAAYYLANGSRMVWLAYPVRRSVEVRTPGKVEALAEGDVLDGADILPGFTLPVREIFDVE
jgi:Uma2 family endonuclease